MKKRFKILPAILIFLFLSFVTSLIYPTVSPESIYLHDRSIVFEEINAEKTLECIVIPEDAVTPEITFVSEDESIAKFDGDSLISASEGETAVYAIIDGTDIRSEAIPVKVICKQNENFQTEEDSETAKSEEELEEPIENKDVLNEETVEKAEQKKDFKEAVQEKAPEEAAHKQPDGELTSKKADKEAESKKVSGESTKENIENAPPAPSNSAGNSEIVYIGETGNKYHYASCSTLKNGAYPISLSEALAQGREACKRCH